MWKDGTGPEMGEEGREGVGTTESWDVTRTDKEGVRNDKEWAHRDKERR